MSWLVHWIFLHKFEFSDISALFIWVRIWTGFVLFNFFYTVNQFKIFCPKRYLTNKQEQAAVFIYFWNEINRFPYSWFIFSTKLYVCFFTSLILTSSVMHGYWTRFKFQKVYSILYNTSTNVITNMRHLQGTKNSTVIIKSWMTQFKRITLLEFLN